MGRLPILPFSLLLVLVAAGPARADCTCRAQGRDFDLGATICLATPSGDRLAACSMVLNVTSWEISGVPCVSSNFRSPARPEIRRATAHTPSRPGL
ncbi:MAG: hypothetical protein HXY30_17400 [Pseudorhodoplanes sp.]|nr:hypothetical protein [Pseudorhodoplanes sp.]